MTKKDKKAAAEPSAEAVAEKPKKPGKQAKTKPEKEEPQQKNTVLSGKVDSIRAANDGGSSFHFTLKGKSNRGTSISFDPADAQLAAAMAQVVVAAATTGARLAVRLAGSGDGPHHAAEIEVQF